MCVSYNGGGSGSGSGTNTTTIPEDVTDGGGVLSFDEELLASATTLDTHTALYSIVNHLEALVAQDSSKHDANVLNDIHELLSRVYVV